MLLLLLYCPIFEKSIQQNTHANINIFYLFYPTILFYCCCCCYCSNNFLVSEEVLEVGDLQVGGSGHDDDADDTEDEDTGLNLLVLLLQLLLVHHQVTQLLSQLFHHVLHFLCLYFNWFEVFFSDDISVVLGLNTSLNHKIEFLGALILISHTHLIAASYEC